MNLIAHVDHFYRVENEGKSPYYRFNVFVQSDCNTIQLLSLNWRFQNDKLHPPEVNYKGSFYTPTRVSAPISDAIYRAVIAKVGEIEGRVIPYVEKHRKLPQFYLPNLQKTLPEVFKTLTPESLKPRSKGAVVQNKPTFDPTNMAHWNDVNLRPSYIPSAVQFNIGPDDPRLKWTREEWENRYSTLTLDKAA